MVIVTVTSGGSVLRTVSSLCLTPSITLIVFSPDARRMSSCTPGRPSAMNSEVATFLTESSAYPISDTRSGTPFTVATMTSLNCSVASTRPSVRRPTSHLPCSSVPPGISTFSCLNGVHHLVDRQSVRIQLLDVDDDVDFARAIAAHRHGADAVDRFERALHLLVGDLGERAKARARAREHEAHDRVGVGILLLDDRGQRLGRNRPHRAGDLFADGVGGVLEVALEDELDVDVGGAAGVDVGRHLIDAGDAAEGVLHRHDDGRRHLVGRGARQPQLTR